MYSPQCFKVVFGPDAIYGKKKKESETIWYFQVFSIKERDKWIAVLENAASMKDSALFEIKQEDLADESESLYKFRDLSIRHSSRDRPSSERIAKAGADDSKMQDIVKRMEEELKMFELDHSRAGSENLAEEKIGIKHEELLIHKRIEELESYENNLKECKKRTDCCAWDVKFQKFWSETIDSGGDLGASTASSERLIDHVGKFRATSSFYVKAIVNELQRPLAKRMFKPVHDITPALKVYCDDEKDPTLYLVNGIVIKLCMRESVIVRYVHGRSFQEEKWKAYGKEFRAFSFLCDALCVLSKPKEDHSIRVPLSCVVDYKGFRGLAVGAMSLGEELDPVSGLSPDGVYRESILEGIAKQLPSLGKLLNIKDHDFMFLEATQPVHIWLSPLAELHRRDNKEKDCEVKKGREWDLRMYETELNKDLYYLLKTHEIFPTNYDQKNKSNTYLRPEFLCK
eukprot:TRINITY_DN23004_c0_g1_i2.p1 TRINITY_DN23004_c0_g1~~TRINITY_DN23004_c0_g1_i2.p1  ORF type:complete len:492 (+),score=120.39 TRINITY_DN23004_c0_g1_i2:111-1478(+)